MQQKASSTPVIIIAFAFFLSSYKNKVYKKIEAQNQ